MKKERFVFIRAIREIRGYKLSFEFWGDSLYSLSIAGVAELADALDSKSSIRKNVWVRLPPPALNTKG